MCNWSREATLTAQGGVQRLAWAGVYCVQVTREWVRCTSTPFLASSLLQPCSVRIKLLLALSLRQELLTSLYNPERRGNQPAHARSGRVETVNLEYKCACTSDFERHRSLPHVRTAAVIPRSPNGLVGIGQQVEIGTSVAVLGVPWPGHSKFGISARNPESCRNWRDCWSRI
jgi:hypothetical protein